MTLTPNGTPVSEPGNPSPGVPTVNPDGTYTFTPTVAGEYNFLVPVCPPGQTVDCPEELLTITILDPNVTTNPPTANPDNGITKEGNPVAVDVKANDKCNNGSNCTLSNPTIVSNGNNGTAVVNPDGTITCTPDAGFVGKDTIAYAVCDNHMVHFKGYSVVHFI